MAKFIKYLKATKLSIAGAAAAQDEEKQDAVLSMMEMIRQSRNDMKRILSDHRFGQEDEMIITYGMTGVGKSLICQNIEF